MTVNGSRVWVLAARPARSLALVLGLVLALGACRSAPQPRADVLARESEARVLLERELEAMPGAAPADLRLALAFDEQADLDLFVTGPREETVYFANTPSAIGGRLDADLRCDAPAPRVETVTFPAAPAGRYRVGVDFPRRCDGDVDRPVVFVIRVERGRAGASEVLATRAGAIRPGEFLAIALEVDAPSP